MAVRSFGKFKPNIHPTAFVHPTAEIIGDVVIGKYASVWPHAVLRGDNGRITIGDFSNVQDNSVLHADPRSPVRVGQSVTIGHGVIVHSAKVGDRCLVGMGAILLDCAVESECLVAAGCLIPDRKHIPKRSLVLGMPGKVLRKLNQKELAYLKRNAQEYVLRGRKHAVESWIVG